jgi:hypothetical protein
MTLCIKKKIYQLFRLTENYSKQRVILNIIKHKKAAQVYELVYAS